MILSRKTIHISVFLAMVILIICACGNQNESLDPESPIVLDGIQIKVDLYTDRRIKECKEKALDRALFLTDSLMASEAFGIKSDTLQRPDRVEKPVRPSFKEVPDSIEVKPILNDPKN